jgi:hypothetical protein
VRPGRARGSDLEGSTRRHGRHRVGLDLRLGAGADCSIGPRSETSPRPQWFFLGLYPTELALPSSCISFKYHGAMTRTGGQGDTQACWRSSPLKRPPVELARSTRVSKSFWLQACSMLLRFPSDAAAGRDRALGDATEAISCPSLLLASIPSVLSCSVASSLTRSWRARRRRENGRARSNVYRCSPDASSPLFRSKCQWVETDNRSV